MFDTLEPRASEQHGQSRISIDLRRDMSKRVLSCIARASSPGTRSALVITAIAFALTGCATALMPTPVLYTGGNAKPLFTELSTAPRRSSLDLLFITNRAPAAQPDDPRYTAERSRSMAFGSATIEFGEDVSWDNLENINDIFARMEDGKIDGRIVANLQ